MIQKYTLRFTDFKTEQCYQQFLDKSLRKYILMSIIVTSILWTLMDFFQSLIEQQFQQLSIEIIFSQYVYSFILMVSFTLIYVLKPNYMKWALIVTNHAYAYIYWTQTQIFPTQQTNLGTFVVISSQFITLVSAEWIETVYQLVAFTSVYAAKMLFQNESFLISLLACSITTGIGLILIFYHIQKCQRERFQLELINKQWETIFGTLIKDQYFMFDYDDKGCCFNFCCQRSNDVTDTESLREFLRSSKYKGENLEQYLHKALHNNNLVEKFFQESFIIEREKQQSSKIQVTIFQGIKPMLIVQHCVFDQINSQKLRQSQEICSSYYKKYQIFMEIAKKYLFTKAQNKRNNYLQFKRLWIHQYFKQKLILDPWQELLWHKIYIQKLLGHIRKLYPGKKIVINNQQNIQTLQNNFILITFLIIDILEKISSQDVLIELKNNSQDQIKMSITGFFNQKSFLLEQELSQKHRNFISSINFTLFQIQIVVFNLRHLQVQEEKKNCVNYDEIIRVFSGFNYRLTLLDCILLKYKLIRN